MPSGPVAARVTSLAGGISTQPPHLRLPDQIGDASNCVFDLHNGISKRPGARFRRRIIDFSTGDHVYRIAPLDYGDARFVLIYGEDVDTDPGEFQLGLKILTEDGDTTVLDITEAAREYLDLNTPQATDIRVRKGYIDDVLIINTLVPTRADSSPTYSTDAEDVYPNYDVMTSNTPDADGDYAEAENDTPEVPAGFYQYDVDGLTFAYWTGAATASSDYNSPSGFWNDAAKNPGGFKLTAQKIPMSLSGVTYNHAGKTLTKTGAFASYSHEDGDEIYVLSGTGAVPGWYAIASKDSADQITLTTAPGVSNQTDFATASIGAEYEVEVDIPERPYEPDMHGIARIFQQALRDAGCEDGCVAWRFGTPPNGSFVIMGRWRGSGAAILGIAAPASGYDWSDTGRPFEFAAVGAVATAGTGSASPGDETKPVKERWVRIPESNSVESIPAANRMPVVLRRDGLAASGKHRFVIDTAPWEPRLDGDEDTNPAPDFMREMLTIDDVVCHRNRLAFLSGPYTFFSGATRPWRVFKEDPDNLTDADPFGLTLGGDKSAQGEYLVPFQKTIVAFTTAGQQYELSTPETLAPDTAAWSPSTRHPSASVLPCVMHENLYFLSDAEDGFMDLMEYSYDDIRVATTAEPVTTHVRGLLPSGATTLVAEPVSGVVVVLPSPSEDPGTNEVFVYRAFYRNKQKAQSAWTRWEFPSGWKIRDVCVLGRELFMLTDDGSRYCIDSVPLSPQRVPDDFEYYPHLDRWFEVVSDTVTVPGFTLWTYPQTLGAVTHVVLDDGTLFTSASAGWSANTTSVVVSGAHAGTARLGFAVPIEGEFTRPYSRDQEGRPDLADDLSIIGLTASYRECGALTLTCEKTGTTDRSREVESDTPVSGELNLLSGGLADEVNFTFSDASPRPTNIAGLKWSMNVTTKFV